MQLENSTPLNISYWKWRQNLLQSRQVKYTPLDYINELIIWKLNPFVVPNSTFILKMTMMMMMMMFIIIIIIIIINFTRKLVHE